MATTGFWPIKGKLSGLIHYIENPEKTGELHQVDRDLYAAVHYVGNLEKTDKALYVDSINCPVATAYEHMMATKRRFGKLGGNMAYHGYQSFDAGEVTPEEALAIGRETAQEMWGDWYEVLIAVHLNTDNLHCHFLVNSVSFRDGRKFENHIRQHRELRDISDRICRERGKRVLEDSNFYSKGKKKEYWVHKRGGLTHRDMLILDIEECLRYAMTYDNLIHELTAMGYRYDRVRGSIQAPDWERPIRLDRLGYSAEIIEARFDRVFYTPGSVRSWNEFHLRPPKEFPLLTLEKQIGKDLRQTENVVEITIDLVFLIVIALLQWMQEQRDAQALGRVLSPSFRTQLRDLDEIKADYALLSGQNIHSVHDLTMFRDRTSAQITSLEQERQSCRNQLRRPKPPEKEAELRQRIQSITERLKPLRKEIKAVDRIAKRYPELVKQLDTERRMEAHAFQLAQNRERSYAR